MVQDWQQLFSVIFLVSHLPSFIQVLQYATSLEVRAASPHEKPKAGRLYVAPDERHLELGMDETFCVERRGRVKFVSPSADLLFESMANVYQERAIALVLSGAGSDGAQGIRAIRAAGGFVIAQDQHCCESDSMPCAAIKPARST
jgi:two-component system chemotaxis response regulator CheB